MSINLYSDCAGFRRICEKYGLQGKTIQQVLTDIENKKQMLIEVKAKMDFPIIAINCKDNRFHPRLHGFCEVFNKRKTNSNMGEIKFFACVPDQDHDYTYFYIPPKKYEYSDKWFEVLNKPDDIKIKIFESEKLFSMRHVLDYSSQKVYDYLSENESYYFKNLSNRYYKELK